MTWNVDTDGDPCKAETGKKVYLTYQLHRVGNDGKDVIGEKTTYQQYGIRKHLRLVI